MPSTPHPTRLPESSTSVRARTGLEPTSTRIQRIEVSFPSQLTSVRRMRNLTALLLQRSELIDPDLVHTVQLLVSEIVTNAITHAHAHSHPPGTDLGFALECDPLSGVRIEVDDHATGVPQVRHPGPDEENGRGMQLVEALAEAWGRKGSCTWCVVPTQGVVV
ncbi:ATP-binding protein [Streptomyces sp. NPDC001889]